MEHKQGHFRQLESLLTMILYLNIALFIGYLVTAGLGLLVAKIILAVLTILLSLFCHWMLFCAKELFRPRGLWMTCAFFSLILCTVVSLIFNFPAP